MNDLERCLMDDVDFPAYLEANSSDNIRADILELMQARKPKKAAKRFVKPTISELEHYFYDRKHPACQDAAQAFYDHYDSNGWKVGGKGAMKCWKASVRNWMRNHKNDVFGKRSAGGMLGTNIDDLVAADSQPKSEACEALEFMQQSRTNITQM